MCSTYDGYAPSFFSVKPHRARKVHRCCECPTQINIGDTYFKYAGKWGSDFQTYTRCSKCAEVAKNMDAIHCSWTFTELLEGAGYALESTEHRAANPTAFQRLQDLIWGDGDDEGERVPKEELR